MQAADIRMIRRRDQLPALSRIIALIRAVDCDSSQDLRIARSNSEAAHGMAMHRCQFAPRIAPVRALKDCAVRIVGYPPDRRIERLRVRLVDYDLIEAIAGVIKAQNTRPRLGSVSSAVDLTIVCAQIEAVWIRWINSQRA